MKPAKLLLALAAGLFLTWIGYLAYLVVTTARPAVHWGPFRVSKERKFILSRPQFLAADFAVSAELNAPDGALEPAGSVEIVWSREPIADPQTAIKGVKASALTCGKLHGYQGPGRYILPLQPGSNGYEVAPVPPSPGYPAGRLDSRFPGDPEIYPDTPDVRAQLKEIH